MPPGTVSETLSYLNQFIPSAIKFFAYEGLFETAVTNPLGRGVTFGNTQTTVNYTLSIGSASVDFSTVFGSGHSPYVFTVGSTLSTVDLNYSPPTGVGDLNFAPSPEPYTLPLVACGLLGLMHLHFKRRKRGQFR
jgi:hypothetical protein